MVMPKRDGLGNLEFPNIPIQDTNLAEMLKKDNAALKKAGCELASAALRVISDYDGLHRLMLATANWAKAIADEGGRGDNT